MIPYRWQYDYAKKKLLEYINEKSRDLLDSEGPMAQRLLQHGERLSGFSRLEVENRSSTLCIASDVSGDSSTIYEDATEDL